MFYCMMDDVMDSESTLELIGCIGTLIKNLKDFKSLYLNIMLNETNDLKPNEASAFDSKSNDRNTFITDIASCMTTICNNMDDFAKYSQMDSTSPWNFTIKKSVTKFLTELLPDHHDSARERELLKAISKLQKKIQITTIERKESELAVQQLSQRLQMLKQKLNECDELYLLPRHPSIEEIHLLERLANITKEVSNRTNVIKSLEEQEMLLKESFNCKNTLLMNKTAAEFDCID